MSEKVVVSVNEGKLRGFKTKTEYSGSEYYSFLGIPYAQPTGGIARFKDPVKVKPWNNILDATTEREGCLQYSLMKNRILGSENCLYNNVYTQKIPTKGDALKAVIVCIHPGGMFHGSPDPSCNGSPEFFIHHDIVYVGIAFRLHVLGLLNLNLNNCSGNQAIKDIILSLRWIKENIHNFGGDPDNVTLMGASSGSCYVHLLLLSPLSKGLYHKAILMGMYAFNPLLLHMKDNILVADEVARTMGYDGKQQNSKHLLQFYRKLNPMRIITSRTEKYKFHSSLRAFPSVPFVPAGDPSENSPLPSSPEELIPSTNRVPVIIGFCKNEGAIGVGLVEAGRQSISEIFCKSLRLNCWGWTAKLNDDELKSIQKEVENFYLNGKPIEAASKQLLCDIITDVALSDVYDSLINVIAKDMPSSVYVYNFNYGGHLDYLRGKITQMMKTDLEGAFHAADFNHWNYNEEFAGKHMDNVKPKDRVVIDTLTNLLTTFAKSGDPNYRGLSVNWKPTTLEHPSHLIIDETVESRDEILNDERLEFWHKLKKKVQKNQFDVD